MSARYASTEEIARWNELIIANPDGGNVFASYEYLQQKLSGGYKVHHVIVDDIAVSVLEKNTAPLGKLWYLPKGPNVTSGKELFDTLKALRPLAKKAGVFVRIRQSDCPQVGER